MKKRIVGLLLVLSMIMSMATVFGDGIQQSLIHVDGKAKIVRVMNVDGSTAYALRDLASSIGAEIQWNQKNKTVTVTKENNTLVYKANSDVVIVNGQEESTDSTPTLSGGMLFVEINFFFEAMECDVEDNGSEIFVSTVRFMKDASSPQWLFGNRVLVSTISDEGVEYYILYNTTKQFTKLIAANENAVEAVVSPDGTQVAYINEQGAVYVVNTFNGRSVEISKEDTTKSELKWGPKGDKIYYIAGEKSNVIAEMNLADGKITAIIDDKVDYKSDLSVSNDGMRILYAVTKTGRFTDKDGDISVDTTGTEPQLYCVNLSQPQAKSTQLTNNKDYKSSIYILNDGQAVYIGADESENSGLELKIVSQEGNAVKKVEGLDILRIQVLRDNRVLALGRNSSNVQGIYLIDPVTASKALVTKVDASVVDFRFSVDGAQILVVSSTDQGESISLLESKMTKLTK